MFASPRTVLFSGPIKITFPPFVSPRWFQFLFPVILPSFATPTYAPKTSPSPSPTTLLLLHLYFSPSHPSGSISSATSALVPHSAQSPHALPNSPFLKFPTHSSQVPVPVLPYPLHLRVISFWSQLVPNPNWLSYTDPSTPYLRLSPISSFVNLRDLISCCIMSPQHFFSHPVISDVIILFTQFSSALPITIVVPPQSGLSCFISDIFYS